MTLLLKTNIETEVKDNIKGSVARIGGTVNQLVDFKNCKVTDINILDGGYGEVKKIWNIKSVKKFIETGKRYTKQAAKHFLYGEEICRDWKTILFDMHFATEHDELKHKFDASISSNVLEHSPNPILLLLNFYFITKKNGYQFHAIPYYKFTFDVYRQPTPVEHLLQDFVNKTGFNDKTHNEDYHQSAVVKHGFMKIYHNSHPIAYPSMHFHVFDEKNINELFSIMFEEVANDILKTDTIGDSVIIFKNKLNPDFVQKY